jgi:hypothetical protein
VDERPSNLVAAADFGLRLAFFAIAPFLIVFVAELFPVTGAIAQIVLALVVFFAGEAVRRLAARSRLAASVLSSQLAFEAYYRAHPPRPFLYYVFYPFLFPYWLTRSEPRREFLLYKGYTLASFGLLLVMSGYQYVRSFPPELGVRQFLPLALGTFAVETVVVLAFLMPIVTSVVHFHHLRANKRLAALLLVGLVSIGFAAYRIESRRDPMVSFATRTRVRMRSQVAPAAAVKAQQAALHAAWRALPHEKSDVDSDGKVEKSVLDAAHGALGTSFYKSDEANAFDLWYTRKGKTGVMVVYFEARQKNAPIWMAMDQSGALIHDQTKLPRGAFNAMWRATQ